MISFCTLAESRKESPGEQTTRATNEDTSAAALTFLKSIANGCDYMMKNFEERKSNRQAEMDGLSKAKAIFAGADFSSAGIELLGWLNVF